MGLFDDNLNVVVVEYTYDFWGNIVSVTGSLADTLGQDNPFRYRGYYFDSDTGLYYLNSRYYDAEIGRFISSDNVISDAGKDLHGYNLFVYCFNNPVNLSDESGNWPSWAKKAVAVATVAVAVVAATVITVSTFGAGSVAGVAAITGALSIAARATEVAVLQIKKDKKSGKSNKNTAKNTVEALYNNGRKVIGLTPATKMGGASYNTIKNYSTVSKTRIPPTITNILSQSATKSSMALSSAFAAYNWGNTIYSLVTKDQKKRAEDRGIILI